MRSTREISLVQAKTDDCKSCLAAANEALHRRITIEATVQSLMETYEGPG